MNDKEMNEYIESLIKGVDNRFDVLIKDRKKYHLFKYKQVFAPFNLHDDVEKKWYRFYNWFNIPNRIVKNKTKLILYVTKKASDIANFRTGGGRL